MKKHILLLILTLVTLVSPSEAEGQQYPVDCRVMVPPPYSGKFTDYAHTPGKLRVQLLLRDLSKPELEVSLRIRLKSPVGLVIENPPGFMYTNPIRLTPGVTRVVSVAELAENFDASALESRGIDLLDLLMGGYLPTGPYEWEVIAYEHYRDRQVSNVGSALMMFSSNLPPMLNLPGEGSILHATQPQNVLFSWTPRHIPGTALGLVSYTLTLYELPDGTDDPQDYVLNSGMPYRIIETTQTSYSYGPGEVPLTPGKRYAWQVRVQADAGFENQGYSTVNTFRYGTPPCEAPANLTAEEDGGSVWFSWEAVEGAVSYTLSIDGTEHTLSRPPYLLQGAEAGHTYTYRVQTVCSGGSRSPVSALQTLTIPSDQPEEQAWYSDPEMTFESDAYYGYEETYLDDETTTTEPDPFDGLFDSPITIEVPLGEPGGGQPVNVLPADPSVEQLQEVVGSQKPTCAGIIASYSCGSHNGTPAYSGATIPVQAGDELAMNSLLLTIVEIDGGGNGIGKIKMPMLNGAYIGLKLSGIQAVEGGCIVGGRAEIAEGVPLLHLDQKLKENLQTLAAGLELTASIGQHYANEIANGINYVKDAINNLKNKKENTRKLLEATDIDGNINPAIESCVDLNQTAISLQDSLHSVYCDVQAGKIKGLKENDLKKALDANKEFMNKLGPALAECQNTQFTPWTEQPCKGPCGEFFEVYAVDANCVEKLKAALGVDLSQYVYDFTSKITLEDLKQFDDEVNSDNKTKYKKNLCGEYLMYDEVLPNLGGAGSVFVKVPPKGKKAISSFFSSDIEYYQYLVLRTLYSDKVGCKQFVLGQDVYLDEKFFKMREKLLMFLGSGFSSMNIAAVKKGITNNEEWNGFKQMIITDLFDETKPQNEVVEWIEYVDNAIKFKTLGEITAGLTFDVYIEFAPFISTVFQRLSKVSLLSKYKKIINGGNNYVYRAITKANAESLSSGKGIFAKAPNGSWSLEEHLIHGSSPKSNLNDPWISTTPDNIAKSFSSEHGMIRIDLSKVSTGNIQRGWLTLPRTSGGYHYSIWQQEVSIFSHIPQEAIQIIK
jgi:hypothetical protein